MTTSVNQAIALFAESTGHFFRDQQRSAMTSPMFNLPGRLLLGSHCYYENLPRLLVEICRHASAEEIGLGMKRLCSRPNCVHLNSLALGYLIGREQARLTGRHSRKRCGQYHPGHGILVAGGPQLPQRRSPASG